MANRCRQCFGRNGTAEARSKHGDLFRRQCSLAPLLALLGPLHGPGLGPRHGPLVLLLGPSNPAARPPVAATAAFVACPDTRPGMATRRIVVTKPSVTANSGSGRPASTQRRIMSSVPVPIRSMYSVRYSDSASRGLPGTELCASRSFSSVSVVGRRPGFRTSSLSAKSMTCTLPLSV